MVVLYAKKIFILINMDQIAGAKIQLNRFLLKFPEEAAFLSEFANACEIAGIYDIITIRNVRSMRVRGLIYE